MNFLLLSEPNMQGKTNAILNASPGSLSCFNVNHRFACIAQKSVHGRFNVSVGGFPISRYRHVDYGVFKREETRGKALLRN